MDLIPPSPSGRLLIPDVKQTEFRGDNFVRFHCPACACRIKTPTKYGGRPTQCIQCKAVLRVPIEGEGVPQAAQSPAPKAAGPQVAPTPEPAAPAVGEFDLLLSIEDAPGAQTAPLSVVCPKCDRQCGKDAVLCVGCGSMLKEGAPPILEQTQADAKSRSRLRNLLKKPAGETAESEEEAEFKLNGADKGQLISAFAVSTVTATLLCGIWLTIAWFTHQQWSGIATLLGILVGSAVAASIRIRQPLFGFIASGICLVAFLSTKLLLAGLLIGIGGSLEDRIKSAYQDDIVASRMAWNGAYSPAVGAYYQRATPKAHYAELLEAMKEVAAQVDSPVDTGEKERFTDKAIASAPAFQTWLTEVQNYKAKMPKEELQAAEETDLHLQSILSKVHHEIGWLRAFQCLDVLWFSLMMFLAYCIAGKPSRF